MGTEFRKTGTIWHWCPECPDYPKENFESVILATGLPEGETCATCRDLDSDQKCTRQE